MANLLEDITAMRQQTRDLLKSMEELLKKCEADCESGCVSTNLSELREMFAEFSLWLEEEFRIHWKLDVNENNRAVVQDMEKVLNEERRRKEMGGGTKKR